MLHDAVAERAPAIVRRPMATHIQQLQLHRVKRSLCSVYSAGLAGFDLTAQSLQLQVVLYKNNS